MLTATYRLQIGSRLRQLALLTAIGAVLNTSGWLGVPNLLHRDSFNHHGSGSRVIVELHHAGFDFHHVEFESGDRTEP